MYFDISNDAEFSQEDLNLDDTHIDEDSPPKDIPSIEKISIISEQDKTPLSNNSEPNSNNKKSKTKQQNKHRQPSQISAKKRPVIDFSGFDFGAIDENNEKSSIQKSIQDIPSEVNDLSTLSSMLEARVSNYLDVSLSSLKSDVLNEIEFMFTRKNSIPSMIDSFLLSFASDIRNEIHYLRSFTIIDQPINISIEIDLPKSKPFSYQPLSTDSFLNQISYLKSQYSQKLADIGKDLSTIIKSRDAEISQILNSNIQFSNKLRQLQNKIDSLDATFNELDYKMQLIYQQNNRLNDQIKEFEAINYDYNMKKKDYEEIKNSIEELSDIYVKNKKNTSNQTILQKMDDITYESKEISRSLEDATKKVSFFSDSFKKMSYFSDYQLRLINQHNQNTNYLRYSAPSFSGLSHQSSLLSSTPKIRQTPLVDKAQYYSPIYVRKTPNYEAGSDDEMPQVTNYLLDKQFSPTMSHYT